MYPNLEWVVSDILDMKEFESRSFDIVIEKVKIAIKCIFEGSY